MNNRKFVNLLAYIAIILIAVSTVFSYLSTRVFNWNSRIGDICGQVSFYIACFVTLTCAFYYASSKRNSTFMFLLVVVVIVLILFMFIL